MGGLACDLLGLSQEEVQIGRLLKARWEGTLKIGENDLPRDVHNRRIKSGLKELKHRGMMLVQHRENHRIWELEEGDERRWTCGEAEYYSTQGLIKIIRHWLALIVTLPQLRPGSSGAFYCDR